MAPPVVVKEYPRTKELQPSRFYKKLDGDFWSISRVAAGLGISDDVYHDIRSDMIPVLKGLLEADYKTSRGREVREVAVARVESRLKNVLHGVPQAWRNKCTRMIIRRCAQQVRHASTRTPKTRASTRAQDQNTVDPGDVSDASDASDASYPTKPEKASAKTPVKVRLVSTSQQSSAPFASCIIIVTRVHTDSKVTRIACNPRDLLNRPKSFELITPRDLQFSAFLQKLEKLQYDRMADQLKWQLEAGVECLVVDMEDFCTALEHMHSKGLTLLNFTVTPQEQATPALSPLPELSPSSNSNISVDSDDNKRLPYRNVVMAPRRARKQRTRASAGMDRTPYMEE